MFTFDLKHERRAGGGYLCKLLIYFSEFDDSSVILERIEFLCVKLKVRMKYINVHSLYSLPK